MNYNIILNINKTEFPLNSFPIHLVDKPNHLFFDVKKDDYIELTNVADFYENEKYTQFIIYKLCLKCINEKPLEISLDKKILENYIFDKNTKKTKGNILNSQTILNLDTISYINLFSFINSILETCEENIKKFIRSLINQNLNFYYGGTEISTIVNIFNITINNINEVEKILNSNNEKIIIKNIKKSSFNLNTESKLSKSVGLPNFAITSLKKERLEANLDYFTQINELVDGNDLKMLLDLFKNLKKFLTLNYLDKTSKGKEILVTQFLKCFISLIKGDYGVKYKTKELLNYLLKQSMYYGHSDKFEFPFEEIKLLNDYLNMCSINNITADKFPQNLRKYHNILVINTTSIANIDETQFINEVTKYKKYEMTLDGFKFILPKKPYDLLEEGTTLHHCISSYAFNVANGKNIIFFMRDEKSPNAPMITIEINNEKDIVEIKEIYNVEPDIKYKKVANKWAGLCKKNK